MYSYPINYNEPLFRPPAEAFSSIIQITLGCSWNRCAFCEMYSSKKFRIREFNKIQTDIRTLAAAEGHSKKIFLADGNAFVLKADRLLQIINELKTHYKRIQRISSYALPKDILNKTSSELIALREAGLKLLYIGIESGDDEVLTMMNKGESYNSTLEGISKAHEAGFDTSVMVLNGLGGKHYSQQHAINSAKLINQISPKFLSTLTLSTPYGKAHFENKLDGKYSFQTERELAEELKLFIENITIDNAIFRSDHVSNQVVLKGVLSKDKQKLIDTIKQYLP